MSRGEVGGDIGELGVRPGELAVGDGGAGGERWVAGDLEPEERIADRSGETGVDCNLGGIASGRGAEEAIGDGVEVA